MDALAKQGEAEKAINALRAHNEEQFTAFKKEFEAKEQGWQGQLKSYQEQAAQKLAEAENSRRAIEARAAKYALDVELSRALNPYNFVDNGREDAIESLRSKFSVTPEGESFAVKAATGQTVQDYVAKYIESRPYLLAPKNTQGGIHGGPTSAATSPPQTPAETPQPKTLGEAVILHMQGMTKDATVNPQVNMGAAFGLKAAR
jgi:hypothetical protein